MAGMTHEEIKAIADKVAKTPYNADSEGPLEFPAYNGAEEWGEGFGPLPHVVGRERKERPTMKIADSALDFVG